MKLWIIIKKENKEKDKQNKKILKSNLNQYDQE